MNKSTAQELSRLRAALKEIAAIGDTGSDEYRESFGHFSRVAPGWRVAEKMREVAIDAIRE